MKVETFEVAETCNEPLEASEEAIGILNELGLEGQLSLVAKCAKSGRDTRFPYREMTADEVFVYQTICPQASKIHEYKASPIPLRVLQVAAHVKGLMPDLKLYVWDKVSAEIRDPVLVAEDKDHDWSAPKKRFYLARWGEELDEFPALAKKAVAMHREKLIAQARTACREVEEASSEQIAKLREVVLLTR